MRQILMILLISGFILPLAAQKRAFTIADLYQIKSVNDPQYSPDGRLIAFTVTEYFLESGKSNTDVYVMNADGGSVRQLTRYSGADYHPRWSPDGSSIYFLSTRKNGAQLWRIPLSGGEAEQLTDFSTGVEEPRWSPNGKSVYFYSRVFPECGADDGCNQQLSNDLEEGPLQAHLADNLFYRHWTFWKDGTRLHTFRFDFESKKYLDLTPVDMDAPSFTAGGDGGFDISPDGRELCVAANPDSNEWETTNKDLYLVSTSGGELKSITAANKAYDARPQYSPDGRYIAYLLQTVPGYESDRFRLAIYDRQNGKTTVLTEAFDNWVADFLWSPDSRSIYFTAEVRGHRPLYRVDISSAKITPVVDLKTIDSFDLSADGKSVIVARRAVGEPRELWRFSPGKAAQQLTNFNRELEQQVDIRPAEEMWIDSPTGKKIHTFVVKPHNFDPAQKYPLILNVHGGPQSQWTDGFRGDWQVYPGAGYVVAFANPHGSTGYGQEFTHAISQDWGGKVYEDVMAVADSLAHLPYVDEERMGAMGWSYGGYMMMWLEGHTTRFKAIAAMMGLYNLTSFYGATEELWFPQYDLNGTPWTSDLYDQWSPHRSAQNFKTPCLVITGEKDFRVPFTQSLSFFTALQKQGVPSRLIVFKNDGHWPSYVKSMPLYYNAHLDWFHRYLGGDPAPYDVKEMVRNRGFKKEGKNGSAAPLTGGADAGSR